MAFSWNPYEACELYPGCNCQPPGWRCAPPLDDSALVPTKTPSVPAEKTVGAWPHAGGLLLVGASALEGAEPRQAHREPRLFVPWLAGHSSPGASAPSSALSGGRGPKGRPPPSALTEGATVVNRVSGTPVPRRPPFVSALSEAAAPPAGARMGSPAVADRSYLPGNDDNAAAASLSALGEQGTPRPTEDGASTPPCSLSAPPPYPMRRRRRALLFGSVRAW